MKKKATFIIFLFFLFPLKILINRTKKESASAKTKTWISDSKLAISKKKKRFCTVINARLSPDKVKMHQIQLKEKKKIYLLNMIKYYDIIVKPQVDIWKIPVILRSTREWQLLVLYIADSII